MTYSFFQSTLSSGRPKLIHYNCKRIEKLFLSQLETHLGKSRQWIHKNELNIPTHIRSTYIYPNKWNVKIQDDRSFRFSFLYDISWYLYYILYLYANISLNVIYMICLTSALRTHLHHRVCPITITLSECIFSLSH